MRDVTIQDMVTLLNEIGEQVVVAMVERGDGEEHDPTMEMLARKVQIINAITERVKDMTAVEFLEKWDRMCKNSVCDTCPLKALPITRYFSCKYVVCTDSRRAVEVVKKWKEERDGY